MSDEVRDLIRDLDPHYVNALRYQDMIVSKALWDDEAALRRVVEKSAGFAVLNIVVTGKTPFDDLRIRVFGR